MHTYTKILDREVTSAIELSTEQCEVKPQIGSLVGKESGHTPQMFQLEMLIHQWSWVYMNWKAKILKLGMITQSYH